MSPRMRLVVFALAFVALHALLSSIEGFERWFIETLTVPAAAGLINLLGWAGEPVSAQGARIVAAGGGLHVLPGCEGLDVLGLWIAAVTAGPFTWTGRLLGWTLGTGLVYLFNQVRLISLFDLHRTQREWFGDAHGLWWPLLLVAGVFVLYLAWQRWFALPVPPAAGTEATPA